MMIDMGPVPIQPTLLLAAAILAGLQAAPGLALDVQGHRGCRGLLPENTLPAFRKALELGVTTIELDLRVTRDDVLVVHHDATIDARRCVRADGSAAPGRPLRELDAREVVAIDCGRRTDPDFPEQQTAEGATIPTFDDVLRLARDASYEVRLNVEIKLDDSPHGVPAESFAEWVVAAIRRFDLIDRTTVQCFEPRVLQRVAELEPRLDLAVLVRRRGRYDAALEESGARILSPKYTRLRRRDVARLQARGVSVVPWTVNGVEDIRRMIDWGVAGIISDYPDRVLQALETRPARD